MSGIFSLFDSNFLKFLLESFYPFSLKKLGVTCKKLREICNNIVSQPFLFYGQKSFLGSCLSVHTNLDDISLTQGYYHEPVKNVSVVHVTTCFACFQTACKFCANRMSTERFYKNPSSNKFPLLLHFETKENSNFIVEENFKYPFPYNKKFRDLLIKEKFFVSSTGHEFKRLTCQCILYDPSPKVNDPCIFKEIDFEYSLDNVCFDQWFDVSNHDVDRMIDTPRLDDLKIVKEKCIFYVRKFAKYQNGFFFYDCMWTGEVLSCLFFSKKQFDHFMETNTSQIRLLQYHRESNPISIRSTHIYGHLDCFVSLGFWRYEDVEEWGNFSAETFSSDSSDDDKNIFENESDLESLYHEIE